MISNKILIFATLFVVCVASVHSFTCPDQCACLEIPHGHHKFNHAKCSSLDGLRQLGRSSDLHSLDLSDLNLEKITNQLDKLLNVSRVVLHNNRLSEVNNLSTKRIRILDLSNNRITSGKLSKIPVHVKHLNLTHNEITYLPLEFKRLTQLKSLELADNPLNCTCETLDVRNWLQERNVWTDKPILCMSPIEIKGRPWLQIRQSDICEANGREEPRMLPFHSIDDENDLMHGDDPNAYVTNASVEDKTSEVDEMEKDFIPVDHKSEHSTKLEHPKALALTSDENGDDISDQDYEGSGSLEDAEPRDEAVTSTPIHLRDDLFEGSGEDGIESAVSNESSMEDDDDETTTVQTTTAAADDEKAVVFSGAETNPEENEEETILPVVEERIVAVNAPKVDTELVHPDAEADATNSGNTTSSASVRSENAPVNEANPNSSRVTYIFLIVIGVMIVLMILYVANKRRRNPMKNRRNNNDIEATPAQEMLNMDKNNQLGKPITNGTEFIPLIPGKHPVDKENNLCNAQEPLLKKLTEEDETESKESLDEASPKTAVESIPEERSIEEAQNVQSAPTTAPTQNGDAHDGKDYQPISPKPSRYSPVSKR